MAVAASDVDQERQRAEPEPERDQAERHELLERDDSAKQAHFAQRFLSDDPHERQRVARRGGKS